MSVVVPQSVMQAVEAAAKRRRLSVSEFVEKALAAKSTAVLSDPYLEARAKRADGRGWKLLDEAPDVPPLPGDERL